jgi:hypothetical protein
MLESSIKVRHVALYQQGSKMVSNLHPARDWQDMIKRDRALRFIVQIGASRDREI